MNFTNTNENIQSTYATTDKATFIKRTYQYFAGSLMAAGVGAYVGMDYAMLFASYKWVFFILEIGLLMGVIMVKNETIKAPLLFAFALVSGLTITPLLAITFAMPGGAGIVTNAFVLTSVAFGGISVFAMNTKKDYTEMGKFLFIALIIVVVASVINMFTQSSLLQIAIASVSALLFSAFILYDTQKIIKGHYAHPIDGAIALYLDFLNLFISLLQILGFLNKDD